jgi:filamentous hemagglutinin
VAGNKDAHTGDADAGIKKIFDADKVSKDVNAQVPDRRLAKQRHHQR